MQLRVRLFARQREIFGAKIASVEVPDGARLEDAWQALVAACPALAPSREYVRFARNGEYAEPDVKVSDGDEIAFIPPVSGGADEDSRIRIVRIGEEPIDHEAIGALESGVVTRRDGAVVSFVGRVRETPGTPAPGEEPEAARHAGRTVLGLEYEAYDEMALRVLGEIADEIEARFGVRRVAVQHRVGSVAVGEASVAIAVASPHRGAAFDAARYLIDELKARAPIWKSERFEDGSVWIGQPARPGALERRER